MSKSQKNYLSYALRLVIIVIAILLVLYLIPQSFINKYSLRPIDILSDIRKSAVSADSAEYSDMEPEPMRLDTCPAGMVCFDDFSKDNDGLDKFFSALSSVNTIGRPVRIAFFGDSFIEGDIFSGDLREKLQARFGGKGVGMLPITSKVSSFRQTITHKYGSWRSYSVLDSPQNPELGISGNVFVPGSNSWVNYQGVKQKMSLDTCQRVSVFYKLKDGQANVACKINQSEQQQLPLVSSDRIERLNINGKIGEINLSFAGTSQLYVYGVSMEDSVGVIVDNYSVRGTAGTILKAISSDKLEQFNNLLQYDLIILEYGLNVMDSKRKDYKKYKDDMVKNVQHLQQSFPKTSFLLIGISDRSMRSNGQYQTMPVIHSLISAQKGICAETGIVFWNLYEAMGGENSMVKFVNTKPPMANKDYTHLNFKGGEYLANILFETIVYGKERYNEKMIYLEKLNKNKKNKK